MADFNFDGWCNEHELDREITRVLRAQHLDKFDQLQEIGDSELTRIGLSVGHGLQLRRALIALGNSHLYREKTATNSQKEAESEDEFEDSREYVPESRPESRPRGGERNKTALDAAEDALEALMSSGSDITLPGTGSSQGESPALTRTASRFKDLHDPRMLLTVKASSKKARKILQFVTDKVKERIQKRKKDRLVFTQSEDGAILFKPAEEEVHSITMAEWGAANMRLLSDLLGSGELAYTDVEFYLAYTMQIYELSERFEWASLMEFDNRYREIQAEYGFRWGDMRFASQIQLLTPRTSKPQLGPRRTPYTAPKEDCKKWLASGGKFCPFGSNCRFQHKSLQNNAASKNEA